MSRVFVSPLATPFHSLVSIFPIPSRYISIFRAPPPRYFSPSLSWADRDAIERHRRMPHYRAMADAVADLLADRQVFLLEELPAASLSPVDPEPTRPHEE